MLKRPPVDFVGRERLNVLDALLAGGVEGTAVALALLLRWLELPPDADEAGGVAGGVLSELVAVFSSGTSSEGNFVGAFLRIGLGRGESLRAPSFSSIEPTRVAELVAVLSAPGEAGSAFRVSLELEWGTLSCSAALSP